jgi:hypothetical protein
MSLAAAEGSSAKNHVAQRAVGVKQIAASPLSIVERVRRDPAPIEASQVALIVGRDVTVGDQQIQPAVVIQVDKFRIPRPATHFDTSRRALITEAAIAVVLQQRVPTGQSLDTTLDLVGSI